MINGKTTAVRLIPVPGREAGELVSFGGLFGECVVMPVRGRDNPAASSASAADPGADPQPAQLRSACSQAM